MTTISGKAPLPKPTAKRRVLIVDDHPLLRRGLAMLIRNESDLMVCAQVATHQAALAAICRSEPGLVIADLALKDDNALGLIEEIHCRHPHLPVLVLTLHDEPLLAERAFRVGARGYLTKQEMGETVLLAIRCLLGGRKYVSQRLNGSPRVLEPINSAPR
jgi:DNA-binding NarL/FixJ family response regulator